MSFPDPVLMARWQFAFTVMFHILWAVLIVGLSLFLVVMEAIWIRTGNPVYLRHVKFWTRFFLICTAAGVASGFPMSFQFGMNWSRFSEAGGDFFGHILGYEGAMAFMLEASFLGIMIFGWKRVSRGMHLFATTMVALGASLSAFWILVANSWMQHPGGGHFADGRFVVTDYFKALFTPDMFWSVTHMWMACLEISFFTIGGLSAWYLLKGRQVDFFLRSFKISAIAIVIVAPLQIWLGDGSGITTSHLQPEKFAAMESHWETNPPGQGAPWHIVAWPDAETAKNRWEVNIPNLLSLLGGHALTAEIKGLRAFPKEDRPPVVLPFYAFRVMVLAGMLMAGIMVWTLWTWRGGGLTPDRITKQKGLLYAWISGIVLGYLALQAGWIVREVGRQPWIIYRMLRTAHAVSPIPAPFVGVSLVVYLAAYGLLVVCVIKAMRRLIRRGPTEYETLAQAPHATHQGSPS